MACVEIIVFYVRAILGQALFATCLPAVPLPHNTPSPQAVLLGGPAPRASRVASGAAITEAQPSIAQAQGNSSAWVWPSWRRRRRGKGMPMAANGRITVKARTIRAHGGQLSSAVSKGCKPNANTVPVTATTIAAKHANRIAEIPFLICRAAHALPNPETNNRPSRTTATA
jgi:hypothetical protein